MSQLTSLWHYLYSSPNFVPSVVGVAAAFFGSWGAQVAILRREQRREVISTLNSVNEGIALCFTIANAFMSLKSQHLVEMLTRFRDLEKRFEAFQAERAASTGEGGPLIFAYEADLLTLPVITVPVERLEKNVFEKLGLNTRPLALAIELVRSIDAANSSVAARNDMLAKWYGGPPLVPDEFLIRYLGVRAQGGMDAHYKTTLFGIETYCNDCIYFSKLLSESLNEHGKRVRRKYRHHIFWRLPKVSEADFSSQKAQGLIPDAKEYEQWLSGFQKHPTTWERIKAFLRRWLPSSLSARL